MDVMEAARADTELLASFLRRTEASEGAFRELVARHGGMVHQTCQRILGESGAAEDAAQATFLVLAQRASSIHGNVGAFLHAVACNVALQTRKSEGARRAREKEVSLMRDPTTQSSPPAAAPGWEEIRPLLDAAIARLPAAQRSAVILRYLENRSEKDTAQAMGIATGTVGAHLHKALTRLRGHLSREGVALPSAALITLLSEHAPGSCPAYLLASAQAGKTFAATASVRAAELARQAQAHLAWAQLKSGALVLAAVAFLAGGGVGISLALRPPASSLPENLAQPSSPAELVERRSISQYGITWTFEAPARVGQFVNGDYYVAGPVTVRSVDPAPRGGLNGSMKNPIPSDDHGFHGQVHGYREELSVAFPARLEPGDALVSTIGVPAGEENRSELGGLLTGPLVKSAAVLTCLADAVPPDTFRPAFYGKVRTLYQASQLHRERIPVCPIPIPREATPEALKRWERIFERPWLESSRAYPRPLIHPVENMPGDDRIVALAAGEASLYLCLDFPPERRETLLIRMVQRGIDIYGNLASHSGLSGGEAFAMGRKWLVILAGILLDDPALRNPPGRFSEDQETYYGMSALGDGVLWRPEFGRTYEERPLESWKDEPETVQAEGVRLGNSWFWPSQALAVRLFHAEEDWGESAFLDYMDRWMLVREADEYQAARNAAFAAQHLESYSRQAEYRGIRLSNPLWQSMRARCAPPSPRAGKRLLEAWDKFVRNAQKPIEAVEKEQRRQEP